MPQPLDKLLFPPIDKKDWERVLRIMNDYSRENGFVDYDSDGKMLFFDSDPFINGVHALFVDRKTIQEIIDSY